MQKHTTYIVTASGPNIVRIQIHLNGECLAWTEGTPEEAEATAAAILDSVRLAREKTKATRRVNPGVAGIPE